MARCHSNGNETVDTLNLYNVIVDCLALNFQVPKWKIKWRDLTFIIPEEFK